MYFSYVPSIIFFSISGVFFSSMSLFSQSSFQTDPNSNEYLLAKFGFDTAAAAENEPCKVCRTPINEHDYAAGSAAAGPAEQCAGIFPLNY